jgi:hypothetical protein
MEYTPSEGMKKMLAELQDAGIDATLRQLKEPTLNTVHNYPTEHYEDLYDLISFEGFEYSLWSRHEVEILQPRMETLGFINVTWLPGETDSFGPLTRVCRAEDAEGKTRWFLYG